MRFIHTLLLCVFFGNGLSARIHPSTDCATAIDSCVVGFYDQDSIALRMKGFRPLFDSVNVLRSKLAELQNQQFIATDRLLSLTPADAGAPVSEGASKEIAAAKKETADLDKKIVAQQATIDAYVLRHLKPFYDRIGKAADTVRRVRDLAQVWEINAIPKLPCPPDQTAMIDLSREIAEQLGIHYYAFRIGVYNRDSLLMLMPGYAALLDSGNVERRKLEAELVPYNTEIAAKQHELDSLRPKLSSRKIEQREKEIQDLTDKRDEFRGWHLAAIDSKEELRLKAYWSRLNSAVLQAMKEQSCRHAYDDTAFIPWTDKEVEYVDLDPFVAQKLLR